MAGVHNGGRASEGANGVSRTRHRETAACDRSAREPVSPDDANGDNDDGYNQGCSRLGSTFAGQVEVASSKGDPTRPVRV